MKKPFFERRAVAGVVAPPARPTVLGALIVATIVTSSIALLVLIVGLILG